MTLQHRMLGLPPHAMAVQLDPGQALWCLSRRVLFATQTLTIASRASRPGGSDSLFARAVDAGRRIAGGGSSQVRWVSAQGAPGVAALADPWGGQVVALELTGGAGWRVLAARIVAAESTVTAAAGPGLDRLAGSGTLFVSAIGDLVEVDPSRHGGRLLVSAERLVAHEATVVARDDGDGVLELTGPGRVLLDTVATGDGDEPAERPPASWRGDIGMDLIAKAKEAAERAAALAQGGLAQGQTMVDEFQAQRRGNELLRALGTAYWEEQREGGDHEAVVRALAALDAHVAEHGPVAGPPPPPPSSGTVPPPPPPTGSTLGDL